MVVCYGNVSFNELPSENSVCICFNITKYYVYLYYLLSINSSVHLDSSIYFNKLSYKI